MMAMTRTEDIQTHLSSVVGRLLSRLLSPAIPLTLGKVLLQRIGDSVALITTFY